MYGHFIVTFQTNKICVSRILIFINNEQLYQPTTVCKHVYNIFIYNLNLSLLGEIKSANNNLLNCDIHRLSISWSFESLQRKYKKFILGYIVS